MEDDKRRAFLLALYSIERAEQQQAIQQTLATVAAAVAYTLAVASLLFSRCSLFAGCTDVADAALVAAPLPALGFFGFLINNQALIEHRDRYMQTLEEELVAVTPMPRDSDAAKLPNFVRDEVSKVYGPGEPRHRKLAGIIWGVAAFLVTTTITVASMIFSDDVVVIVASFIVYLPVGAGLTFAAFKTLKLNRRPRIARTGAGELDPSGPENQMTA